MRGLLSDILTFFIFLLAVTINCPATKMTSTKSLSQTPVVNAPEFRDKRVDLKLPMVEDHADEIRNLPLLEAGIGVEDLLVFFPLTVSKAVLHMAHPRPPELLRL